MEEFNVQWIDKIVTIGQTSCSFDFRNDFFYCSTSNGLELPSTKWRTNYSLFWLEYEQCGIYFSNGWTNEIELEVSISIGTLFPLRSCSFFVPTHDEHTPTARPSSNRCFATRVPLHFFYSSLVCCWFFDRCFHLGLLFLYSYSASSPTHLSIELLLGAVLPLVSVDVFSSILYLSIEQVPVKQVLHSTIGIFFT